jgi:E3 ubiquitin-protein ligase UBR4
LFFCSLESDPCLVCNNPEVPYSSLKLSTLKVDTKYTTTTQIVKLTGSHSITKISLRFPYANKFGHF